MSNHFRFAFAGIMLVALSACSSNNPHVTIGPRETYEVGRSGSGAFTLTTFNEGETNVIVTCNKGDYLLPVTLGPNGSATWRIAADGWVLLMNTSESVTAKLFITIEPLVSTAPKSGPQRAMGGNRGG